MRISQNLEGAYFQRMHTPTYAQELTECEIYEERVHLRGKVWGGRAETFYLTVSV